MSLDDLLDYAYGLCNLSPKELKELECVEFCEFVYHKHLYVEKALDRELQYQAWFTANQMLSSGNYKKGTKAKKLADGLYVPLEDRIKQQEEKERKRSKEYVEEEKEKLMNAFGISIEN